MAARVRWRGKTTERGYGHQHRTERERRLKQYRPGDPCAHCGRPILYAPAVVRRYVDLPHTDDRTGYLPGLAHTRCNRADGQAKTTAVLNARRGTTARLWRTSRQW